jgi:uncharacterized membrane protein YkgB
MQENTLSVSGVFSKAWGWWKQENKYVYYLLFPAAVLSAFSSLVMESGPVSGIVALVVLVPYFFFAMCASASLLFFVSSNQKEQWQDWKKYLRLFLKFIGVNILLILMVFGGLLLLIVPGIYLAIRYAFVPYYFLENPDKKIGDLFKETAILTENNRFTLFLALIVSGLISAVVMGVVTGVVGVISSGMVASVMMEVVSFLVVTPLFTLVGLAAYTSLKNKGVTPTEPEAVAAPQDATPVTEEEPALVTPEPAV